MGLSSFAALRQKPRTTLRCEQSPRNKTWVFCDRPCSGTGLDTKFFGGSQATYIMRRTMNRRELLKTLSVGAAMELLPSLATAQPKVMPKALIFDTFGTVVDWRG